LIFVTTVSSGANSRQLIQGAAATGRNKLAVCSKQYEEDEEQSAELNFIRLKIDLPASVGPGRVCEEMQVKIEIKIKKKICQGHPYGKRQIAEQRAKDEIGSVGRSSGSSLYPG